MDKLKPVFAQIFWILFGIALLLPVIGWFMGRGTMAATIDTRIAAINGLNPQAGATVPNDSWIDGAKQVEEERQKKLETASDFLWDQQQQFMNWPQSLGPVAVEEIQSKTFKDDLTIKTLQVYRRTFDRQVEELRQIVDPYEWKESAQKLDGKVLLDQGVLPLPFAASIWQNTVPTSDEVWYLQEDIWLLKGLLEAVKDVNDRAGPDANIMKTPIKQILSIELTGGNREALAALTSGESGGEAGAEGGMGAMPSGMSMPTSGYPSRGGGGEMGEGGGAAIGGALDFDVAEEVGPAAEMAAGGEGEGSPDGGMGAMHSGAMSMPGLAGLAGEAGIAAEKRYVDDVGLPYKTRAFKMQVIMDHRQLPEFLVELTNSPFPVCILRVHFAEMNTDPTFAGGATGGYGGGYGSEGGMGGSSFMGSGSRGGSRPLGGMSGGYNPPGMSRGGSRPLGSMSSRGMSPMGGGLSSRGMSPMGGGLAGRGMPPMGGMSSRGMPPMGGMAGRGMLSPLGQGSRGVSGIRPTPFRSPLLGSEGGDMYGEGMSGQSGMTDLSAQALADPFLAQVVVAGLMTIYRSEKEIASAAEGEATTEAPVDAAAAGEAATEPGATPEEGATPEGGATPVEGLEPLEGAQPADGVPASEGTAPVAPAADGGVPAEGQAPAAATPTGEAPAGEAPAGEAAPDAAAPTADAPLSPQPGPADDAAATSPTPQ